MTETQQIAGSWLGDGRAASRTTHYGTIPEGEWQELLATMRDRPWREALAATRLPVLRQKSSWFLERRKGMFYAAIPLPRTRACLDLGAGSGVISEVLAERFDEVVAVDRSPYCVQFMRGRFAQDGRRNVRVVMASAATLPFDAARFDLVVVNGLLEWIACSSPQRSPLEAQLAFLREVRRVLAPGGKLGLAIENRYHTWYFAGVAPHGEPPYACVLPRRIADVLSRRRDGVPYRTWIHSAAGLRRLLERAGFAKPRLHLAVPSYYDPREVYELAPESLRLFRRRYAPSGRFAKRAALHALDLLRVRHLFEAAFYAEAEA